MYIPNSFKASTATVLNAWARLVHSIPGYIQKSIKYCYCAVALPGDYAAKTNLYAVNGWHPMEVDLQSFFGGILNLHPQNVGVYSNSACFLRGAIDIWLCFQDRNVLGIHVGTNLSAAIKDSLIIRRLNRRSCPFNRVMSRPLGAVILSETSDY
jgi:hypothetical protein